MPHIIVYNSTTGFVEATVEGVINFDEVKEIFSKGVQTLVAHESFLYLADYREAVLDLSIAELYELPQLLSVMVAPLGINVRRFKRAVVIAKDLQETRLDDYRFYETVTVNRGQNSKLFEDIDQARHWLTGQ